MKGCACAYSKTPLHDVFDARHCHAIPLPPVPYVVRVVAVSRHSFTIVGFDEAFRLATALRRAYPDRWVDVKLDGALVALLEPKALVEESDQLELEASR